MHNFLCYYAAVFFYNNTILNQTFVILNTLCIIVEAMKEKLKLINLSLLKLHCAVGSH